MTAAPKRAYRHPQDKTAYRVMTWREYDQALRDRSDITLSIRQEAIDTWTALTLRLLLHLPLRQTERSAYRVHGELGRPRSYSVS